LPHCVPIFESSLRLSLFFSSILASCRSRRRCDRPSRAVATGNRHCEAGALSSSRRTAAPSCLRSLHTLRAYEFVIPFQTCICPVGACTW
jgi:hypothetical protein